MRQVVFSLVILTCRFAFAEQEIVSQPEVLNMMYRLWADSGFGKDPNRTERAAWIVNDSPNRYRCIRWPRSAERNREFWYAEIPQNSIAQIHTHTDKVDPRPAAHDIKLAKRIRIPIYTISSGGIWIADRNGIVKKICGSEWYKNLRISYDEISFILQINPKPLCQRLCDRVRGCHTRKMKAERVGY